MKLVISRLALTLLHAGVSAQKAGEIALATLVERTGAKEGLVLLGKRGDIGIAHCTACLAHAYVTPEGEFLASIQV